MPRIGLRELKIHLSEVAKDVQENKARYTVTSRGEPVALLVPYSRTAETDAEDPAEAWEELALLLTEAGRRTPAQGSTDDLMDWSRGR